MTKMNVPKLRFKGFSEEWEEKRIGHKSVINTGKSNFLKKTHGRYAVLGSTGIIGFDSEYDYDGDFLLVARVGANAGNIYKNKGKVKISDNTIFIKNENTSFLYGALYKFNLKRLLIGSGMSLIKSSEIKLIKSSFPILEEQEKIGLFIEKIDKLIELQTKKLEALKKLKQGYLQKMFPQDGEKVPRLRFTGFSDEWEVKKLGKVLSERNIKEVETKDYPLMAFISHKGIAPKGNRYDRSALVKDQDKKYKITEINDFIYSSNNFVTGSIGLNRYGNATISPVYSVFYTINNADSYFLDSLSKNKLFIYKMLTYQQGVTYGQQRINENDFLNIKESIPTPNEQKNIGMLFNKVDRLISLYENKLDELNKMKEAYLQKMFI